MKADVIYNDIPQYYERSLAAPVHVRYIDGARLTLNQVNYYAALIIAAEGDVEAATRAFRANHKMVRHGCCGKWHPILAGGK